MIFAASCVESAARAENVSSSEMYQRMKRVGLIEGFILKCYEGLHTQSRQHVTEDVLGALVIWETKKGVVAWEECIMAICILNQEVVDKYLIFEKSTKMKG